MIGSLKTALKTKIELVDIDIWKETKAVADRVSEAKNSQGSMGDGYWQDLHKLFERRRILLLALSAILEEEEADLAIRNPESK